MCTNKVIFSKVMTQRKTVVNTFNLQSINGPCFLFRPVFSLCIFVSVFLPLISPSVPWQSIVVAIVLVSNSLSQSFNHFHSINIQRIFGLNYSHIALLASIRYVFSIRFLPSLSPTCHTCLIMIKCINRQAMINQNMLLYRPNTKWPCKEANVKCSRTEETNTTKTQLMTYFYSLCPVDLNRLNDDVKRYSCTPRNYSVNLREELRATNAVFFPRCLLVKRCGGNCGCGTNNWNSGCTCQASKTTLKLHEVGLQSMATHWWTCQSTHSTLYTRAVTVLESRPKTRH